MLKPKFDALHNLLGTQRGRKPSADVATNAFNIINGDKISCRYSKAFAKRILEAAEIFDIQPVTINTTVDLYRKLNPGSNANAFTAARSVLLDGDNASAAAIRNKVASFQVYQIVKSVNALHEARINLENAK